MSKRLGWRRWRRAVSPIALIAVLVCFVLAAGAGRARTAALPHGGALVFASDLGIFVANLDGTGLTRLTDNEFDSDPVWSPDGTRIAFDRTRMGNDFSDSVMVMNANGTGLRRLGSGMDPAWSPDGATIAFEDGPGVVSTSGGTIVPGFTIVNADGTGTRRVDAGEIFGSWSPDGKRIAYTIRDDDRIHLLDVKSGATTRLPAVAHPGSLAWSPDGAQIAVADANGLELVDVTSGRVTTLTSHGEAPVWSPDSTRIAFVRYSLLSGVTPLLTIGRDGRGEHRLASNVCSPGNWTADSRTFVFSRPRSGVGPCDIWRIEADGSGAAAVTHAFPTGADFSPYSSPQWAATTIPAQPPLANRNDYRQAP